MKQLVTIAALVLVAAPTRAQEAHPDLSIEPLAAQPYAVFGGSIDIDGDRALIGAPSSGFVGPGLFGAAFIFERAPSGEWLDVQQILPSSIGFFSVFGSRVAIDGDWLAISNTLNPGFIVLYERDASGVWVERQTIFAPLPVMSFDPSIDIEGDRFVLGTKRLNTNTLGYVAVYERQASGVWQSVAIVQPVVSSFQLDAIDLEGDRFVIGASKALTAAGLSAGAVVVFERDTAGNWNQTATLHSANPQDDAHLGASVELEGDVIVAGASWHAVSSTPPGTAHVFERQPNGAWIEVQVLVGTPSTTGDRFGSGFDLDGSRLVVGAMESNLAANRAGAAHVFERDASGLFQHRITVVREDAEQFDRLGGKGAVELVGDHVMVSAYAGSSGVVEVFDIGSLYHGDVTLSLSGGGTHELMLRGPAALAGDFYFVLGSASGTTPAIPLAPGVDLPLVFDAYTDLALSLAIPVAGQFGVLDASGSANAAFNVPAGTHPSFAGLVLHHAYIAIDPMTFEVFASNAARLEIVP